MNMLYGRSSDHGCTEHDLGIDAQDNVAGSLSFHQLSTIISGVCAAISICVMLVFKSLHATHLSNPTEQVKIMRIGTLITMYSLICFLSVCFPKAEVYIHPWLDLVEGFALGSFFLLLCDYVSPHHEQRELFFAAEKLGGVKWFRTRWLLIFQMPVVAFVIAIATDITAAVGVYCEWDRKIKSVKFVLRLISTISLVASVLSILQFYRFLKRHLAHHQPLMKLLSFKIVVFLTFVQGIIFWVLTDKGALKETNTLTFADLHIGIPNMIICIEMVPLSLLFMWAYPWRVYLDSYSIDDAEEHPGRPLKSYQGGPFGIHAWLAMINPSEIFRAILFAFKHVGSMRKGSQEPILANEPAPPYDNHQLRNSGV
ncbi:hypothetical protein NCS56_01374800 [Fusarium sp. Ph1]|nr:hypothetical protein NCS56_01374800 [Fusarium sp. Ph1]